MKFFDREEKIAKLRAIRDRSVHEAQFTVVTGRRRVGKTELVRHALDDRDFVYLFVSRKSESELVEGFVEEVNRNVPDAISSEIHTLNGFLQELFKVARTHPITVFFDEFQDFLLVKPAAFSILQGLWDREKNSVKLNLIVCGSVNTLMNKLFMNRKEPLYGRQTAFMRIEPFPVAVIKQVLRHYNSRYTSEDLLTLWTLTGGVAKYIAVLMDAGAADGKSMIKAAVSEDSFFLEEGRILLGEEFGKDYAVYFSILSAIARGVTTRNEIEQTVGRAVGGYLTRLENDYHLVSKHTPFGAKTTRQIHYQIEDVFYRFWFRFIFRYDYMVQRHAFSLLQKIVNRDYPVFSGKALESYFHAKFVESQEWTRIGNWWDRKGENEIDLIAENELSGRFVVAEVKREKKRIDIKSLSEKFKIFAAAAGLKKSLEPEFLGLAMEDM